MTSSAVRRELLEYIKQIKITNTHCHHLDDGLYENIGLFDVLRHTYVAWCANIPDIPDFSDFAAAEGFVQNARCNTFFRWLSASMQELYSLPLTADNMPALDARIKEAYRDKGYHIDVLTGRCRFEKIINDRQSDPGSSLGHPALFAPSFRCDSFFSGYDSNQPDNDGFLCHTLFGDGSPETPGEFLKAMDGAIKKKKAAGCVALKVAMAYIRPINFDSVDYKKAEKAFGNPNASVDEITAFGNIVMNAICDSAAKYSLPLQIHTGMAALDRTRPSELLGLIKRHPETKFHLLHGGFPWFSDTYALLASFNNVWSDTCWIPYLSSTRAADYIVTALEVSGADRLTWGCDAWMPEDSCGALLAMEHTLSKALAEMVCDGAFGMDYAKYLARCILRENGKELFGV